jgi:pyridoxine kinase
MAILSIQSHVAYGHAGNSAAVFPLQRLGHEVWAINTVEFSNHTGYGAWKGQVLDPGLAPDLVRGIAERGVFGEAAAVLSGYMGDAAVGRAVMDAARQVRAANPKAVYCCDPVMGDVGRGFYVHAGIPEIFKNEVIRMADIVTPNQFELEALTGIDTTKAENVGEAAARAIAELHKLGPKIVLVTSFREKGEGPDLDMLVSDGKTIYRIRTPELPFPDQASMAGSGDLTTAVFLSRYLETGDIKRTLELTTASVFGIMEATFKAKSRELLIVQAQEELIRPSRIFEAVPF